MEWYEALNSHLKRTGEFWVDKNYDRYNTVPDIEKNAMTRKKQLLKERKAAIVKSVVKGKLLKVEDLQKEKKVNYLIHMEWLVRQGDQFYVEEQVQERQAIFAESNLILDRAESEENPDMDQSDYPITVAEERGGAFNYDRLAAIKYADHWWNTYSPKYKNFDVDCTNYVSQCIHEGGVPMTGQSNKSSGWWFEGEKWSYSWSVANALRWYLSKDQNIMQAVAVDRPEQLVPGDVICYDFEGDGRWDHTTFVTDKDAYGMPLVNAHTTNSRHRFWSYEDSSAWTSNIKYKFFHLAAEK